jgi:hypothetical protein
MIPSLGSPRASFVGSPTIVLPADGVEWQCVGPDALEDVTVRWCHNIKCRSGCAGGCHHVSTAAAIPLQRLGNGHWWASTGPRCASKIL